MKTKAEIGVSSQSKHRTPGSQESRIPGPVEARFQPLHCERVHFCFWKPLGLQQPQRANTMTKPGGHPSPTPKQSIFCYPGTREGI